MSNVVRVKAFDGKQYSQEDFQVNLQIFFLKIWRVAFSPLFEASSVLFHDDVVLASMNAVVIESRDVGLQPEILQASDFREDVVKHAAVVDRVFECRDFDGHIGRIVDLGKAVVDGSVCSVGDLSPSLVNRAVVQVSAKQLQQSLASWIGFQVADLGKDQRHDVLVGLVVQVVVKHVEVVELAVGWRKELLLTGCWEQ